MRPYRVLTSEHDVARVTRDLARLEKLAARRKTRIAIRRALRGTFGSLAALGALVKLKIAGSLVLKLVLALVVGLGFAWPLYALAIILIGGVILSILSCEAPVADCPVGCDRKESRRKRLDAMIAQRKDWLRDQVGPAAIG